jgi:hypothetical protein
VQTARGPRGETAQRRYRSERESARAREGELAQTDSQTDGQPAVPQIGGDDRPPALEGAQQRTTNLQRPHGDDLQASTHVAVRAGESAGRRAEPQRVRRREHCSCAQRQACEGLRGPHRAMCSSTLQLASAATVRWTAASHPCKTSHHPRRARPSTNNASDQRRWPCFVPDCGDGASGCGSPCWPAHPAAALSPPLSCPYLWTTP